MKAKEEPGEDLQARLDALNDRHGADVAPDHCYRARFEVLSSLGDDGAPAQESLEALLDRVATAGRL